MSIAITTPETGLMFVVTFTEHHGDHTHEHPTVIKNDVSYLVDRGVTFHFEQGEVLPGNPMPDHIRMWTEDADGQTLAETKINPNLVKFNDVFPELVNGTLDVLSAKASGDAA